MAVASVRVKDLFLAALDVPDSDRPAFLANIPDAADRAAVERLLAAHDAPDPRLTAPKPDPERTADAPDFTDDYVEPNPSLLVGTLVAGRYKLLEQIGEGGMGSVWMAEQREPVKRLVALKLIKPGMDTKAVLTRFEAERQALALMDHPNVARILDGGTTAEGRPYFVMELVKGLPLTEYCDQRRLNVPDRLTLFAAICAAVQHAHQKGIIHRDLKPGNILVTEHDGRPVPKVIDFGLAKALNTATSLTDKTLHTAYGAVVGTPLYMAPEQVGINALDVDTRTDIYALGVVLYELLTGTTPLEKRQLKEAAWEEMKRLIRESDPPRPSQRLSSSLALPSLAANRGMEPKRLTGLVRGEIDWIVMKALEKDRNRRYETANGFAADVQRYLAGEAVLAVPPSVGYRVRKFVRRNKVAVLTAGIIWAITLTQVGFSTLQWLNAETARKAAEAAREDAELRRAEAEAARQAEAKERLRATTEATNAQTATREALRQEKVATKVVLMLEETMASSAGGRYATMPIETGCLHLFKVPVQDVTLAAAIRSATQFNALTHSRPDSPDDVYEQYKTIGLLALATGQYDCDIDMLTQAGAVRPKDLPAVWYRPAELQLPLARANLAAGRHAVAARLYEEVLARLSALDPERWRQQNLDRYTLATLDHQGSLYFETARAYAAGGLYARAAVVVTEGLGRIPFRNVPRMSLIPLTEGGRYHALAGQWAEAEPLLREALRMAEASKAHGDKWRMWKPLEGDIRSILGEVLHHRGKDKAEQELLAGYHILSAQFHEFGRSTGGTTVRPQAVVEAVERLIRYYTATGNTAEAGQWRAERRKLLTELAPPPRPTK